MGNQIPKKLREEVEERDGGQCQYCFNSGAHQHHIIYGGTGRRRIHRIENLITLCLGCHGEAHKRRKMREWCYQWSRDRYGGVVDELLRKKWSGEK